MTPPPPPSLLTHHHPNHLVKVLSLLKAMRPWLLYAYPSLWQPTTTMLCGIFTPKPILCIPSPCLVIEFAWHNFGCIHTVQPHITMTTFTQCKDQLNDTLTTWHGMLSVNAAPCNYTQDIPQASILAVPQALLVCACIEQYDGAESVWP